MKQATGDIFYLSLSSFWGERARSLCSASREENESQQIDFLSLCNFLESLAIPEGEEVTFNAFNAWLPRNKVTSSLGSAQALFEEFRSVIGALISEDSPCRC